MCMQSISRHEIKNVDVALARGLWCIESPDIGPGGSTLVRGCCGVNEPDLSAALDVGGKTSLGILELQIGVVKRWFTCPEVDPLLPAGKPNWSLLATITPTEIRRASKLRRQSREGTRALTGYSTGEFGHSPPRPAWRGRRGLRVSGSREGDLGQEPKLCIYALDPSVRKSVREGMHACLCPLND